MLRRTFFILFAFFPMSSFAATINLTAGGSYDSANGDKIICRDFTPKCLCITRNTGMLHQDDVLLVKNQYGGAVIRRWEVGLQKPTTAFDEAATKCRIEITEQPACQ